MGAGVRLFLFVVLVCLATALVPPASAQDLTLRHARIVDVETGRIGPPSRITITGERIVGVEPESDRPVTGLTLDLEGLWVTPGLWDSHVHALSDPDDALERALPLFVAHGVTSVRDMGSLLPGIREVRARLTANPETPAPRLMVSGPLLDGQALPWYGDLPRVITTPAEAEAAVLDLKTEGMDFLKVYEGLAPPVLDHLSLVAHREGLPLAGHATRQGGLSGAVTARQATVEHLSVATLTECLPSDPDFFDRWVAARFQEGYDAHWGHILDFAARADWALCDRLFAEMVSADVAFTPTLVMEFLDRDRVDEASLVWTAPPAANWCQTNLNGVAAASPELKAQVYAFYASTLAHMRRQGVQILAGSDTPNFCNTPGASLIWELERLVEVGLTPAEALASATIVPARLLARPDRGRVAPGFVADLVVVAVNPLEDISTFRRPQAVVAAGRMYDRAALDGLLDRAAQRARADDQEQSGP